MGCSSGSKKRVIFIENNIPPVVSKAKERKEKSYAVRRDNGNAHGGLNVRKPRPLSPSEFEQYVLYLLDHPAGSTGVPKYITGSTREKGSLQILGLNRRPFTLASGHLPSDLRDVLKSQ